MQPIGRCPRRIPVFQVTLRSGLRMQKIIQRQKIVTIIVVIRNESLEHPHSKAFGKLGKFKSRWIAPIDPIRLFLPIRRIDRNKRSGIRKRAGSVRSQRIQKRQHFLSNPVAKMLRAAVGRIRTKWLVSFR